VLLILGRANPPLPPSFQAVPPEHGFDAVKTASCGRARTSQFPHCSRRSCPCRPSRTRGNSCGQNVRRLRKHHSTVRRGLLLVGFAFLLLLLRLQTLDEVWVLFFDSESALSSFSLSVLSRQSRFVRSGRVKGFARERESSVMRSSAANCGFHFPHFLHSPSRKFQLSSVTAFLQVTDVQVGRPNPAPPRP